MNKSATLPFLFLFFLFSFCMLASHYGDVNLRDKLHSHVFSACIPLAARGVHAFLEVWLAPELWGSKKTILFTFKVKFHFVMQTGTTTFSVYYV